MAEMREKLMHFLNIGTSSSPQYVLLGDGITSLTEEFNPETEAKQYINQSAKTSIVKSYAPSISVEKEYIKDEALQTWIDGKVKTLPTGDDATTDYVRINLFDTVSGSTGTYNAVKRSCAYQFDSVGGESGNPLMTNMTISGIGDGTQGTFNVTTKTFS